ncbi:hypothetical protein [Occallatibacter savannae]|uniref:hypothetical protein n=1 Tax=Occallatibacter savannae TaxID=1002691 RepID=UPI0013A5414F|nr:hypothetical protein [Occallatibacter savannae]
MPTSTNRATATPDDGTRQLLQWGSSMVGAGLFSAILLETVLGGFGPTGAHTNTGWFALIIALMSLPFGGLLLALGVAKWLRNRNLRRTE